MDITVYHSSSSGNLYRADDLLIEAGVPIRQIKKDLDYGLSSISACLLSHSHGDHACATKDILKAGIDCYCLQETAEELGLGGHRLHIIEPGKQFKVGHWSIKPFDLVHDVPCLGFLLAKDEEKLLYANDTSYIPYRFKGLTHIMIGVNYDLEILIDSITCGHIDLAVGKRILKNHMSLTTFTNFLKANDLSKCREIHLLHLSRANSDELRFKKETEQLTGVPVYVAK